jgi:hypothetical protein
LPEPAVLCRRFHPALPLQEIAHMSITIANITPLAALIAGILILVIPRLLNFIVAIWLILYGILGLGVLRF